MIRSAWRAAAAPVLVVTALVTLALTTAWPAAAQAPPAAPTRWVTDRVGFLSEPVRADLDRRLEGFQRSSGHQLLVWIDRSTGGLPLEDFTVRAVSAWKVGRKGVDDGIVLFVFSEDRKARIEVGYGLEGEVPDALAGRIISEQLIPSLRNGERDAAITRSVDALLSALGGGGGGPPPAPVALKRAPPSKLRMLMTAIFVLLLIAFVITHPTLALQLFLQVLANSSRGGRSGGSWGGGGGFSGGGGRFGGGGASGSW